MVSFSNFCSTMLAPAITTPRGPPLPSVSKLFLVPCLPRSVGFLPVFFPPEPGLAQHRVGRLPLPVHPAELVALLDQHGPDLLEDAAPDPSLEPVVDRALGAIPLGHLLPLAAAPHPEDDPIEHLPPVGDVATGGLPGPVFLEDGLDPPPELIGDLPDRAQRLESRLAAGHGSGPRGDARGWGVSAQAPSSKGCSSRSRIVSKAFR